MGYRNYSVANGFIVDKAGNGDFTTISSALTAAVSGDTIFVRTGAYTENLTLKDGVDLTAFTGDNEIGQVEIIGKCTLSTSGTVTISNIRLTTNSDFCIVVSGASLNTLLIDGCYINCTNNTGISFTTSNASAELKMSFCKGNIGTTGISLFSQSSTGQLGINFCEFRNTGASTTASTTSAGHYNIFNCTLAIPLSVSSTGAFQVLGCQLNTTSINTTCLTTAGSGDSYVQFCYVQSGTAACISVGASTSANAISCDLFSTAANVIIGTGTLNYGKLVCTGSAVTLAGGLTATALTTLG